MPRFPGSLSRSPARILLVTGIALLACLAVSSGCTQPVIPSPAPPQTTPAYEVTTRAPVPPLTTGPITTRGPDYLPYTNSRYGFNMSYPTTWTKQENTGTSVVSFTSPSEGRDDLYIESMKVIVEDLSANPMSLEQYKNAQIAKKQTLSGFNKIMDGPFKVGRFNGWKFAYTADTGMLMEWVEIYTIKGTTAYDLVFSAQESHYYNYVVPMDTMINSFQLTD
jgi:hypothetical protein